MTRECSDDFGKIKSYIFEYKISDNLKIPKYISSLKVMHKCYFAAITWNSELLQINEEYLKTDHNINNDIVIRLNEVVSDLGSSLFNWVNGNYKASRVMLRVAIENFIRAISAVESKAQLTEKNVYRLFENASNLAIFNNDATVKSCYESLHADYKLLCEDTHTATMKNMEHLSSLADLPAFEEKKAEDGANIYIRVSKNITSVFCILFNKIFHKMHHRNKENIMNSLNRDIKPIVLGIKS